MSWMWFAVGFAAFPLVALGIRWLMRWFSLVTPTKIETPADLHTVLRALLVAGNDRETLFVVWFPTKFEVRITKSSRKSKPATLGIELRRSGENSAHYCAARARLEAEALEFTEEFTPARKHPKRIRLSWPDGGPFVISAVANVLGVLESSLPESPESCAAACESPGLWRKVARAIV